MNHDPPIFLQFMKERWRKVYKISSNLEIS